MGTSSPARLHGELLTVVNTFDGRHVHAVANRGGATSVHVYSPPLRTMG